MFMYALVAGVPSNSLCVKHWFDKFQEIPKLYIQLTREREVEGKGKREKGVKGGR